MEAEPISVVTPVADAMDINVEPISELLKIVSDTSRFTIFPKLPQEMRLKIWRSTFEPRKITIRVESDGLISPGAFFRYPVALCVCSESRQEALKWYRLIFHSSRYPQYINPIIDIPHIRHGSAGSRRVNAMFPSPWFNFSSAFLAHLGKFFDQKFILSLRNIAIDRDLWVLRMGSASLLIGMFKKLKRLFIVIDDNFLRDEDEWVDIDDPDEEMRDVVRFMGSLDTERKPHRYHHLEEKFQYILRRMKLKSTDWNYSCFTETSESSRYAAYVKEDVLEQLNEGSEPGSRRKLPGVEVVIETSD